MDSREDLIRTTKGNAIRVCDLETTRIMADEDLFTSIIEGVAKRRYRNRDSNTLFVSPSIHYRLVNSQLVVPAYKYRETHMRVFGMKVIVSPLIRDGGYIIL